MSELKLVHNKKTGKYAIIGGKEEILDVWALLKIICNTAEDEDE